MINRAEQNWPEETNQTPAAPAEAAPSKLEQLSPGQLSQFIGTEQWYRHGVNKNVLYTDGIKYVAEVAGAYWLIDEIALAQWHPALKAQEFQVWRLFVANGAARLVADDGNDVEIVSREIEFTDFPLPEIKFYFAGGVLMLPSEY